MLCARTCSKHWTNISEQNKSSPCSYGADMGMMEEWEDAGRRQTSQSICPQVILKNKLG